VFTDGAIGDILYTYSFKRDGFIVDINQDIVDINQIAQSNQTGAIILGGGIIKHHIMNANQHKGGLDFTVLVNTALQYDASDAGSNLS